MVDRVGEQLGNYRLLRLLGEGGFAEVYLGEHIYLNNHAAIKLLHAHLVGQDAEHFLTEAKTLVDLVHPNIVRVLDFAVQEGSPFLVMDYIAGGTLRQQHPQGSRLQLDLVVLYVKQIAAALYYAHGQQVIHRDVKPENMLLGKHQEVVLSDFGIATVVPRTGPLAKKDVLGTPRYMAPEQIDGHPDVASDQYALGVVVYEWLCGEAPFRGSFFHLMNQHKTRPVPPLSTKNADVSHEVEKVVHKALAKDAQQRYESVQAFADALEHAYLLDLARTTPLHAVSLPAKHSSPSFAKRMAPVRQLMKRRTMMIALGGTVLTGAIAGGVGLWNSLHAEQEVQIYRDHSGTVRSLAWSPDGKSLASGSDDNTVQIWDATKLTTLYTYHGHAARVNAVAWSPPDGNYLASADQNGMVQIWQATTGRSTFPPNDQAAMVVDWSHNGKYFATGSGQTIQVREIESSNVVAIFTRHVNTILTLSWSPDDTLMASGSVDGSLYIWSVDTGEVHMSSKRTYPLQTVRWSHDGKVASGYQDGSIAVVDATSKKTIFSSHGNLGVQALIWSYDSKQLATLDVNGSVSLWDVVQGNSRSRLTYTGYPSQSIAWSPDGTRIVSGGNDGTIQIWDTATGKAVATYRGATSSLNTVAWSPDGAYIVAGGNSDGVPMWKAATGEIVRTCRGSFSGIRTVGWLNDGAQIAAGSDDKNVYFWDATSGKMLRSYGRSSPVHAVSWSPRGKYLAVADHKLAWVKEVSTATVTTGYLDDSQPVLAISWSLDGQYIALGGGGKRVRIWSAQNDTNIATYRHLSDIRTISWSSSGKWLASGSDDRSVQIWELATNNIIFTYLEHTAAITALAWSPDEKYIASASSDKTVRVWTATTGKLIFIYRGHNSPVNAVAWSSDGKSIASAGSDTTIHVWKVTI
jgi:WD40 repeat protein